MDSEWEYCRIDFHMRYKGEDFTRSGMKQVWLVFLARGSGQGRKSLLAESVEIPVPANMVGGALVPQEKNPSHLSIHQDLLNRLQQDGWERMPPEGGAWWARRLRRRK